MSWTSHKVIKTAAYDWNESCCHAGQELSSWQAKNKTHFLQESYQQTKLGEMLLMLFYPTPSTQETRIISQ